MDNGPGVPSADPILEGPGDRAAVPALVRAVCYDHGIYDIDTASKPIIKQNIPKLGRLGELERFVGYAAGGDCDSALVVLDTDGICPCEVVVAWARRIKSMDVAKRVGIAFFDGEFECLFLHCLDCIAAMFPDYGWQMEGWEVGEAHEGVVGAKGALSRRMKRGRSYKEVRDQIRFVQAVNFERLRIVSRCFRHFEDTLLWLTNESETSVYPPDRAV